MGEPSVEALYEKMRAALPVGPGDAHANDAPRIPAPVAPGIRVLALRTPTLPPAEHTNVYLIGAAGEPVAVVDPGSPYEDEQRALDAALAETPPALVLLTHHHGDHVGGAAALASRWGVPIAAHAATARRLHGRVNVDREIADDEIVHGAQAVFTPGHAEGHLCFFVNGALVAGDMVAGLGTILIDPSEGDMALYLASLDRMLALPQAALLPAHGPVIVDGHAKLREYRAHRLMREAKVAAALAPEPRAVDELVATAYADTPKFLWPLAERSLLAHLAKLVADGRALVDPTTGRYSAPQ